MSMTLPFIGIITLAILGTPIFVVMTLLALTAFYFAGIDGSAVGVEIYKIASAPTLLTIPLFTFAGYLMAESKSPVRLVRLAQASLGWLPGGVAIMSLVICAFFTAFTGASGVTIIALGGLLYPMLTKEGYDDVFSIGLITSSGSLGLLFPPSLPIILYGIVGKVDIDKLFMAGILPGIFLIIVLSAYSIFKGSRSPETRVKFSGRELWASIQAAKYEIPLPFLVLGGIYGGIITASEAACLTVVYVFIMECFLYRDLSVSKDIPKIIKESMTLVGAILLILCCALGLTNYIVDEEIPMKIMDALREYISNKYVFLIFLNIFLLVVGCLMDVFSAIIVVVPIIAPIASEFQIDPVHLAIIFLTNLEIGYLTPPVGINLFISSHRFDRPVIEIVKSVIPFLGLLFFALFVITYIPELSLALIGD